jgi:hypothetical protein
MVKYGIVGGGIAGLYCAWKLLKRDPECEVVLFEARSELGGRIQTQMLGPFFAECGPMRFELAIEPYFEALTKELNIPFSSFKPTSSGVSDTKYNLLVNEISAAATAEGRETSALDLLQYAIYRIFHRDDRSLKLAIDDVIGGGITSKISLFCGSLYDEDYDQIRTEQRFEGEYLFHSGFWNVLERVLSPEAISKIRDTGTFYHLMPENPSASEWSIFWLRLFRPDADLWTIPGGVSTVIDALHDQIKILAKKKRSKSRFRLELNTTIEKIENSPNKKGVTLISAEKDEEHCDHAILAIPAVPLQTIVAPFPHDVHTYIRGVIPFPLLKVFVVINRPWWKTPPKPHENAHRVPTRELHYSDQGDQCLILFYMDRPATAYWKPYIEDHHVKAQVSSPPALKDELARLVARLLPNDSASEAKHLERVSKSIVNFAIRDWSKPPFGAACHAWAPKVEVPAAIHCLRAFGLKGSKLHNVHICGEAYSDYQGFIEGSLRSAENVLSSL